MLKRSCFSWMHLAAEVIKALVLLPLLHICRRLARCCRSMGIGASLPERLVRAVNQNDAKGLSEVCVRGLSVLYARLCTAFVLTPSAAPSGSVHRAFAGGLCGGLQTSACFALHD